MDVYGCSSSWQMNRASDLPKPGCSDWNNSPMPHSTLPVDRVPPDGHVMPHPSIVPSPWTSVGMPWGSVSTPPLVHFTAHTPQHPTVLHCKRKPAEIEPVIPAKQLITEERIAAHLSGMHISREYREHGDPPPGPAPAPESMEVAREPHEWLRGARTIVLADEIKRLQQEPLIPPSLLQRLEKPCMSLMVWTPKEGVDRPGCDRDDSDDDDESGAPRGARPARRRAGVLVAEASELTEMDVEM